MEIQKEKLNLTKNNFPNDFQKTYTAKKIFSKFYNKKNEELKFLNAKICIAGRIISRRIMGKASFVTIQDITGRIQLYISQNYFSKKDYEKNFKKWDIGDIIGVQGTVFKTKTNELSILCKKIQLLTKITRPFPDKFHGIKDQEIRYRKRYLDLIVNKKSRNIFKLRSKIIYEIRKFMQKNEFVEVETPMMQIAPGGASARPFITHYNTLNKDVYLRISPELYLKRLIIGGFEKIFEINRNFRNEGFSPYHNPEFTMMELYMAYTKYEDLMSLIEKLFSVISKKIFGTTIISFDNKVFDFKKSFFKLTMKEAILKYYNNLQLCDLENYAKLSKLAYFFKISIDSKWNNGQILAKIFEKKVQHLLVEPTFITEYPIEVSPLARRNDFNPEIADRFEFFINGIEIGNGFSELNDMQDQKNRFIQQQKYEKNLEMKNFDEDYIEALEYGLPPTAGLGIGIDRMIMLFTDTTNIRDVIFFPMYRPII